jgi:hypothetical protein
MVLALAVLFAPGTVRAEEAAPVLSSGPTASLDGSLSLRYIVRTAASADGRTGDHDLYTDLRLDVTPGTESFAGFHFLGSARSDLDGNQESHTFNPLEDIGNTHDQRSMALVYEAYAVFVDPLRTENRLRVGRQAGTRNETIFFDGIAADAGGPKVNVTVYGGAAVHFFEDGYEWGTDWLGGAGLDYRFGSSAGLSADYLMVKDVQGSEPDAPVLWDRLVSFRGWHQVGSFSKWSAAYRIQDGEPRDLSFQAVSASPAWDAEGSISYFRQFRVQDVMSTDLSLFSTVLGQSAPYQSADLKVRKTFFERFSIDLGYFSRVLLHPQDEGPFNKDWSRAYASLDIADLFVPRLTWTITAEQWGGGSTDTTTYGTDLAWRTKRKGGDARIAAGTYYSLYKYDYYTDLGVRDKVRTWYLDGKYPLGRGFSMNGRYEYEQAIETYQVLRLGMRYDF